MFKKIILLITLTVAIVSSAKAQQLMVKSFAADPTDISAVKYAVKDGNNETCALIIVQIPLDNVVFEGDVMGTPQRKKSGDYWVYMPSGSTWLDVKAEGYLPPNFDISETLPDGVQGKITYKLVIAKPAAQGLEEVQKGNAKSLLEQARSYEKGIGTYEKDLGQALTWYAKAAEAGSKEAQEYLADVLYEGRNGFRQDLYAAFKWHRMCARRGRVESYLPLSGMYEEGRGTRANKTEAINWLTRYTDVRNDADAMLHLAQLLPSTDARRLPLMKRAAENGSAEAMMAYSNAIKKSDPEQSRYYAEKAKTEGFKTNDKPKQQESDDIWNEIDRRKAKNPVRLKVHKLVEDISDNTATANPKYDKNGNRCALVIVSSPIEGLTFGGNVVGYPEQDKKTGDYLVYMMNRAYVLTIGGAGTADINLREYFDNGLEGGVVYTLMLRRK